MLMIFLHLIQMGEVCAWANRVMLTLLVWTLDCTYSIQLFIALSFHYVED